MLGQLFQNLNSSSRRSTPRNPPLDSVIEDAHTKNLLFPDATSSSSAASNQHHIDIDPQGLDSLSFPETTVGPTLVRTVSINDFGSSSHHDALDLQCPRDIRVLIAQDHDLVHHRLLFDSKPALVPPESPRTPHSRSGSRSENAQLVGNVLAGAGATAGTTSGSAGTAASAGGARQGRVPTIPEDFGHRRTGSSYSAGSGVFQRGGKRKGSISSIHSLDEPFPSQGNRDTEDIQKIAVGCMFENAASTYKGISNKVHIVPVSSKPYDSTICSPPAMTSDLPSHSLSLGRSSAIVRRPSSLSRSHTPGDPLFDTDLPFSRQAITGTQGARRFVLITRTFSVPWMEDEFKLELQHKNMPPTFRNNTSGKSVPTDARIDSRIMTSYRRPWRSLMYAVTIVLSLPIDSEETSPPVSRTGTFGRKTMAKELGRQSHMMYGSSAESDKRFPWLPENLADSFTFSDVDNKVDLIGQHWDIFARALTTLQYIAQKKIYELLKVQSKQPRATFKLPPMALASDEDIMKTAEDTCVRVIRGIKIDRVRTGHGRWSAWREEARWLTNWAGGRDENFFFLTLVSAFLGTHTEWLRNLAPKWYRKRFREQQRQSTQNNAEAVSIPHRTVIVSKDKMAARRLIFLLAAFLPPSHSSRGDVSPIRPGTAASLRGYSQSPPKVHGIVRQESLIRTINRRAKRGTSLTRYSTKSRTSSITAIGETQDDRTETGTIRHDGGEGHARRSSDARSTRSKLYLTEVDPTSQKSDTTTAAVSADPVVIRPLFSRQPSFGQNAPSGHSRNSSAASNSLLQPLQRPISAESQWSGRWGSLRNLLGITSRRESMSDYSDILQSTDEGLGISDVRDSDSPSRIQQMIEDVQIVTAELSEPPSATDDSHPTVFASPELRSTSPEPSSPVASRKVSKPIDVPLKMSVNKEDGVIDVEIPFLDYGSPTIYSPGLHIDHSGSSYGGSSFGQHSFIAPTLRDSDPLPNVGGWLDRLHADFTLQAVKPYTDVMIDVRAAMSAEPNPPLAAPSIDTNQPIEKWLDVCTALVADTSTWTVTRVRLRRLVRFVRQASAAGGSILTPAGLPSATTAAATAATRSAYGNPYSQPLPASSAAAAAAAAATFAEFVLEERFTETRIADHDGALADAVERVISVAGSPSKSHSTASSRSSSRRGRAEEQAGGNSVGTKPSQQQQKQGGTGGAGNVQETAHSPRDAGALILGQLEAIAAEMARHKPERNGSGGTHVITPDTTLKEGVRAWMEEVETKNATAEVAKAQSQAITIGTATTTLPERERTEIGDGDRNGRAGTGEARDIGTASRKQKMFRRTEERMNEGKRDGESFG
jgi:Folliculin-interacting protein N-terminus